MKWYKIKTSYGIKIFPESMKKLAYDIIWEKEFTPKLRDIVRYYESYLESWNYHGPSQFTGIVAKIIKEESDEEIATKVMRRIVESNLFMR